MKRYEFAWSAMLSALILAGAMAWTAAAPGLEATGQTASTWAIRPCAPVLPGYEFKIGRILPPECVPH